MRIALKMQIKLKKETTAAAGKRRGEKPFSQPGRGHERAAALLLDGYS